MPKPQTPKYRLSQAVKQGLRRHAEISVQSILHKVHKERQTTPHPSLERLFIDLDRETGRVKSSDLSMAMKEVEGLLGSERHAVLESQGHFDSISMVNVRKMLAEEYPKFLKSHGLKDSPESVNIFLLGILREFESHLERVLTDRVQPHRQLLQPVFREDPLKRIRRKVGGNAVDFFHGEPRISDHSERSAVANFLKDKRLYPSFLMASTPEGRHYLKNQVFADNPNTYRRILELRRRAKQLFEDK